jgi:hypothetical protein
MGARDGRRSAPGRSIRARSSPVRESRSWVSSNVCGGRAVAARECAEHLLAGSRAGGYGAGTLQPEVHVGGQTELRLPSPGATSACPYPLVVWRHSPRVRPYQMPARIRARSRLSRSSISGFGAGSLGLVIGWRAEMDARGGRLVAPRADQHYIAHHRPAGRRVPGRLEHHRAGQIAPVRRHADIRGSQPEPPALPVQDVAKMLGPSIRGKHIQSTLPLGATSAHTSQSEMTCSPRSAETDSCPPSNATGQTLRTSDQPMDSIVGADTAQ